MLLSCENNIKEVNTLFHEEEHPEFWAKNADYIFTDSTRLRYRALAPEVVQINTAEQQYKEFPQGGKLIYYKKNGSIACQIRANYAKCFDKEELWELRGNVRAQDTIGQIINTELMFWDKKKKIIYSDKYVRLTSPEGNVIEGNGFSSDDQMENIVIKQITGELYLKDNNQN